MAASLWGKVYYDDTYAGELRQEPGGRCVFTYDRTYLAEQQPEIAFTLPRNAEPFYCEQGLHPFFDNLVSEGWLRNAQARSLKINPENRFAMLLAFGHDCAGAVSVRDPNPIAEPALDLTDPATAAALASRASLSGIQPKIFVVEDGKGFRPARRDEISTFIAKLPSGSLRDIIENEYLTTIANRALLPDDEFVELKIATVEGVDGRALLVRRFDRRLRGGKIHFEEFNQLLGRRSGDDKYDASYDDMAAFMRTQSSQAEAWRLYRRILVCFLTGNTDAHLKNFAMFHGRGGLSLTPAYDLVAAALYPEYRQLALKIGNAALSLSDLKPKHLSVLAQAFGLGAEILLETIGQLDRRRRAAEKSIADSAKAAGAEALGQSLIDLMEHRWNGTFALTGQFLSKKRPDDGAD